MSRRRLILDGEYGPWRSRPPLDLTRDPPAFERRTRELGAGLEEDDEAEALDLLDAAGWSFPEWEP